MLLNLPTLERNQTLYSWCAHVHAVNGVSDARATSRALFGAPYSALCHDFPSRLAYLTARFPDAGLGEVELALRHTLLGYFLVLQPRPVAYRLLALMTNGSLPSIKMRLGITASQVGGHHPLKGCDACVVEDTNKGGFAYWHIEHQFPSTMVCARHAQPLFIAWDPVTPVHRRGWLLPVDGLAGSALRCQYETTVRLGNCADSRSFPPNSQAAHQRRSTRHNSPSIISEDSATMDSSRRRGLCA